MAASNRSLPFSKITQLPVGQRASNLSRSFKTCFATNSLTRPSRAWPPPLGTMKSSPRPCVMPNHRRNQLGRQVKPQSRSSSGASDSWRPFLTRVRCSPTSFIAAVKMATPDASDIKSLGTALSQLPMGDVATVPLGMASLAAIRAISEAGADTASAAPAPFGGANPRADARHADLEQLRNQLNAVTFSHQPALKSVLQLSLAVAIASSTTTSAKITEAETNLAQDALTSDAIPWLLTHVASNLPRRYDPLSLPLDTIYRSVSKDAHPIVRYPLSDRSQDLARRELANLVANAIQRLPMSCSASRKTTSVCFAISMLLPVASRLTWTRPCAALRVRRRPQDVLPPGGWCASTTSCLRS
ncbi:hypothetical protein BCR44DRAFT_1174621 [Catenaria anguillulae PL171]|uniref:Uncharacterized protein n=1 Tax=Catenaria anguillulae PL171 TaxID=765915 RepID=A0A1Y2I0R0_9FUNG|nr:hypothetical protein BCR44DRAFT_1174621 [Catenaria anguillulae PL171]